MCSGLMNYSMYFLPWLSPLLMFHLQGVKPTCFDANWEGRPRGGIINSEGTIPPSLLFPGLRHNRQILFRGEVGVRWNGKTLPSNSETQLMICDSPAQLQRVDFCCVLVQEENGLMAVPVPSGFTRGRWLSVKFGVQRPCIMRQKKKQKPCISLTLKRFSVFME